MMHVHAILQLEMNEQQRYNINEMVFGMKTLLFLMRLKILHIHLLDLS